MSAPSRRPSPSVVAWAASIVDFASSPDEVTTAINALLGQNTSPVAIVVTVGRDAASERSATLRHALGSADRLDPRIRLVSVGGNPGFSGGHNRALADLFGHDSQVDVVVVHNPDLVLAPDAVAPLCDVAASTGGLVGPVLELTEGGRRSGLLDTAGIRWTWDGRHFDVGQGGSLPPHGPPRTVGGISGACLAVPRAAYERVVEASGEFFDEDFIAYREDAELAFRAGLLGVPSVVVPVARGLHSRSLRGTRRGDDPWVDRLGVRNRFLIAFKYGCRRPGSGLGPWIRDVVVLAGVLLRERGSWSGVADAWRLRAHMRAKGARVLAAATGRSA